MALVAGPDRFQWPPFPPISPHAFYISRARRADELVVLLHPSPQPKNIKQGIQKTVVDLVLCQPTKHDVVSHVLNEVARNHACGRDLARCTLAEVSRRVGGALKSGLPIHAKLGLRFLACCSANSILAPKALAAVLDKVLDAAASARSKASAQDKRVKNYAYYADYLVYSALCALPSAAASLQSCEPDLLRSILAKARDHLGDVGRAGRMAGDALCVFKGEGYGNLGFLLGGGAARPPNK